MATLVSCLWLRVQFGSHETPAAFYVVLATQAVIGVVSPMLNCLAPALSRHYFARRERGLANSLGTVSAFLGIGAGMALSPAFGDNIPGMYRLHAVCMSVPLLLSLCTLDLCCWCDPGEAVEEQQQHPQQEEEARSSRGGSRSRASSRSTSFQRIVRTMSNVSTPTEQGFSEVRPDEYWDPITPQMGISTSRLLVAPHQGQAGQALHKRWRGHAHSELAVPYVFNSFSHEGEADGSEEWDLVDWQQRWLVPLAQDAPSSAASPGDTPTPGWTDEDLIARETYLGSIRRILSLGMFQVLFVSIGIFAGVFNTMLALVDEAAPRSLEAPWAKQALVALFFGCGFVGSVATGVAIDRTRDHRRVGRACIILSTPAVLTGLLGWHYDNAAAVLVGIALTGLFGFGMLPLGIEYGITLVGEMPVFSDGCRTDVGATVGGVITAGTNLWGFAIVAATTPGNVPGLSHEDIPFVWLALVLFASVLFFALPAHKREPRAPRAGREPTVLDALLEHV
jgi:MFS family permease